MSSILFRLGANAHELTKRSLSVGIWRWNSIGNRNRSTNTNEAAKAENFNRDDAKYEAIQQKLKETFDSHTNNGYVVPAFKRAIQYGNKIAIKDEIGEYSYAQLFNASKKLSEQLDNLIGECKRN